MPSHSASLAARAALALLLFVGFYALGLAVVAAVFTAAWFIVVQLHVGLLALKLAPFLASGLLVLRSMLPNRSEFVPPGALVRERDEPRLFEEIRRVALAAGRPMPHEVYLLNEVNAFAGSRGGFLGLGRKRLLGIGLPLIAASDVSELRAVLAHEFGHECGGETRLAPWIYATRAAMARTITRLHEKGERILDKPFLLYAHVFLRVTHAVSRSQELAADRLAATLAGGEALRSSLSRTPALGAAYASYMESEYAPVVMAQHRPPLAQGFQRFVSQPEVRVKLEKIAEQARTTLDGNPFDTHPPLGQRLIAIPATAQPVLKPDARPALDLLDGLDRLETRLMAPRVQGIDLRALPRVEWEQSARLVWIPVWERIVREQQAALDGLTLADVPQLAREGSSRSGRLELTKETSADERAVQFARLAENAVAIALVRAGWEPTTAPGESITVSCGEERLVVHGLTERAVADPHAWGELCRRTGIGGLCLAPPAEPG